jgi:hypothetical protein
MIRLKTLTRNPNIIIINYENALKIIFLFKIV